MLSNPSSRKHAIEGEPYFCLVSYVFLMLLYQWKNISSNQVISELLLEISRVKTLY